VLLFFFREEKETKVPRKEEGRDYSSAVFAVHFPAVFVVFSLMIIYFHCTI
jgi:hypothetical protein